jgi:hypothetical protein
LAAAGLLLSAGLASAAPARPGRYVVAAARDGGAALLEGTDEAWRDAALVEWGPAPHATAFRALWSPDALYLRFDARDAAPWHTMTRRDEHLWEEEVVEIFIDPARAGHHYAELEISPANVVCDVRMVRASPHKKFDLTWNLEGLETRVVPWRDAQGKDLGWTALARLPWDAFRSLPPPGKVALPPRPGDRWRFNLFRVERPGGPEHPEQGAVEVAWSPTGQHSFHVPAAFRDLVFAAPRARP